jgi:ABC-type multidrug transport system ATPase subunit
VVCYRLALGVMCIGRGFCAIMIDSNKHGMDSSNGYRAFKPKGPIYPSKDVIQPQTANLRAITLKSLSLLDYNKDLCDQDTVILHSHDVLSLTQPANIDGDVDSNLAIDSRQQPSHERNLIGTGICIDAFNLKKVSRNNVVLLNDISLAIPGGAFVALVGSSGAGKSTLMNAMNGSQTLQEGNVFYNGQDYSRHASTFRKQQGYVPQDDIVHQNLTVERALYYAAKMRLPANYTRDQIVKRIDEVLEDVDLKGRRSLMINKLSGGQRKRVSIALELLDKPSVFFLDEPTSGLDPGLDQKMMYLLRKLANKGQTIIIVTHATSNITLCDYICFLAPGGRLAYFGPPAMARRYFGKIDFAEIYGLLEPAIEHPRAPEEFEMRFKSSPDYQKYVVKSLQADMIMSKQSARPHALQTIRRCNGWAQFWLLSLRYLELLKNDRGNMIMLLLQAPIISLLLVALMHYGIGTTMFEQNDIISCPTTAAMLTPGGFPEIPNAAHPIVSKSCSRVKNILQNQPAGRAYARIHGGQNQALQDFIAPFSGEDAQKILFIMSFTAVLFGCVNAVREIVKEAPIYARERAVTVGILPYMFSKIVVLSLLCLFQVAVLAVVINAFAPFEVKGILMPTVLEVYCTLALTSLSGLMIGLALSALASSTDRAMSFIPLILIPQVIFSGTIFPFTSWVTQIFAMFFTARWSIGALGSTIGLHSDKLGGDRLINTYDIYQGSLFYTYTYAEAVRHLLIMWGALGIMTFLLMGTVGVFLKLKDKNR